MRWWRHEDIAEYGGTDLFSPRDIATPLAALIAGDIPGTPVMLGELIRSLQHNTAVHDAKFSPDGHWLVTAALRASLWDAAEGENVLRLKGHEGTVTAVAFDPSGRTIVTGGADGTVRTYRCVICSGVDELIPLAGNRLAGTRRQLTQAERERYLG